jgi:Transposase DDE domain
MQTVLTTVADRAGRDTDFILRETKLRGSTFTQTLVFGWLADADATLEALAQTAAAVGVPISPQGLDQRFTAEAAACLEQVLAAAIAQVIAADPVAVPVLDRFPVVDVQDSSTITLPPALADVWFGCAEGTAGLKIHLRLNLRTGALAGPTISDGYTHDSTVTPPAAVPPGSLRLIDLGYFSLERFQVLTDQRIYWVSRFKTGTTVWDADGVRWDLPDLLAAARDTALPVVGGAGASRSGRPTPAAAVCGCPPARDYSQCGESGAGRVDDPDHERARAAAHAAGGAGGGAHALANRTALQTLEEPWTD